MHGTRLRRRRRHGQDTRLVVVASPVLNRVFNNNYYYYLVYYTLIIIIVVIIMYIIIVCCCYCARRVCMNIMYCAYERRVCSICVGGKIKIYFIEMNSKREKRVVVFLSLLPAANSLVPSVLLFSLAPCTADAAASSCCRVFVFFFFTTTRRAVRRPAIISPAAPLSPDGLRRHIIVCDQARERSRRTASELVDVGGLL